MLPWHDDYIRIEIDETRRVVRQIRSSLPYQDIPALQRSVAAVIAQVSQLPRHEYALLLDMRKVPGRNDPAFEAVMSEARPRLSEGFRRVALLASTHVGRLQIQRHVEQDRTPGRVFLDEAEALQWLEQT